MVGQLLATFSVAVGSEAKHQVEADSYNKARSFVSSKGEAYGLSSSDISALDVSECELVAELLRDNNVLPVGSLVLCIFCSKLTGSPLS